VASLDGREERVPVKGVRKHTAAAMVASAFTAPHVTEFLQVDATETMAAMRRVRDLPELAGIKVSPLLFVARALLTAVARHPMINSSWDEAAQEIVIKRYVNLGIAAATERGLIVPTVKDAHALSLAGLARALDELAGTARAGKATPADLSGGTITITNVGHADPDAGRGGDPRVRDDPRRPVGGGRAAGRPEGDNVVIVVRSPDCGRGTRQRRLAGRRLDAGRPDPDARVVVNVFAAPGVKRIGASTAVWR
jgi:pyruvate/2-oxoglutarate dehydrogenase complex dihydrolipoamide acyltransferase (E2) component